jgi:ferredoxin
MKKVGIVSCYFKNNYGSMLQAYATQKILDNNNIENETINIAQNKEFKKNKKKYYMNQIFNFKFIKEKFGMAKLKIYKKINKELGKNISIRTKKYNEFKNEFNLSRTSNNYKDLTEQCVEKYSNIIVGSDQLWLPVNVVADYYTLNWVPNNINKVSYSTSFGFSNIPSKYYDLYKKFLKRINHLSTREESGLKIIKDITGIDGKLVCDPTMLLTKEEWEKEATQGKIYNEKYIFCYFLGKNIEHRKFVEKLKEKTGYKIVSLNHADEYVKYSDKFCDYAPYDVGPREWINLVKNAEYVCTDSFHGTVFSILFNKEFFDFRRYNNKSVMSTNSRIDSLLNVAGIDKNRICTGNEDIEEILKNKINYDEVNERIEKFREESKEWLLSSLEYQIDNCKHINIIDKEECCGCTACKSICPKQAIEMIKDEEGFLYPSVNQEKCINCGICKKTCPILNKKKESKFKQKGYIFQYKDNEIRKQSTSGGAFTAIADYILDNDGIVFGVGFDENYNVEHQIGKSKKELEKFRNSKYVQSNPKNTFKETEKYLKENRLVCYSGTACQIEGLINYLGKDYENLITVDVICRAVPSPLLWEKYFKYRNQNNNIDQVYFREKFYGYKYSNLTMRSKDKMIYKNGIDTDPYLRAFFSNIASRPSCYNCHFKEQLHKADITIWDCFDAAKYDVLFDDDKGTTRILLNSNKAIELFDKIKGKHNVKEIDIEKLVGNFHQMFNSIKYNSRRDMFFQDLNNLEFKDLMNKYFPNTFKCKFEKYSRIFLIKLGLYKAIITIGKKVRKRD